MRIETLARCELAFDGDGYHLQPGARGVVEARRVGTGEVRLALAAPLPEVFDMWGGRAVQVSGDRLAVRVLRHTRDGFPADGEARLEIMEAAVLTPEELAAAKRPPGLEV